MSSDGGFKLFTWGIFICFVGVLVMLAYLLVSGSSLTTMVLLLIVSMILILAVVVIWQFFKKAINSS